MRKRFGRALLALALPLSLVAAAPALDTADTADSAMFARVTNVHYVETVDDAVIRVEITRETNHDSKGQGVLLTYSPYNSLGDGGIGTVSNDSLASKYNGKGIARAVADVLGSRGSTGCWDYGGENETQSGVDVVNFLSGDKPDVDGNYLTWSNGNVAMEGVSYEGTTATMVASRGDEAPGLKAIIPIAAISHWYGYAFHDGVRYFLNSEAPTDEGFDTPLLFDHGFGDTVHADNPDSVVARADECGAIEHESHAYSRNPTYTEFWQERDYYAKGADFRAAALIVHGWNDYNVKQDEAIRLWEALPVDDPETEEVIEGVPDKFLWMTQSTHANGNGPEYAQMVDNFLYAYLLDDANAHAWLDNRPKVVSRPQLSTGGTLWTTADSWPLPGTEMHSLFLNRTYEQDLDPVTVPGPGTGEVGELSYTNRYQGPLAGRPGAYGPTSGWLDTGAATEEISRNDPWSNDGKPGPGFGGQGYYSLAFQTTPLTTQVRIAGRAELEGVFNFLPGVTGQSLTPILVDISPTGSYRTIQRGFLNLDYRDGRDKVAPAANGWVKATVKFLPEDYIVNQGHRIGLILQSSNAVWAVPGNPAGFVSVGLGPQANLTEHGTRLHLPLVDAPDRIFEDYPNPAG